VYKRKKCRGEWVNVHNEELQNLSPLIRLGRMRQTGHVTHIGRK
jgi:hypothetical protein